MNLFFRLMISLVIAAVAATLTSTLRDGALLDPMLLIAFAIATMATALAVSPRGSAPAPAKAAGGTRTTTDTPRTATRDAPRERGRVKWFNASKGFGFIIKEDGEEIFVHFRSIRGEGRRGLRDGQNVSFVVAQSDKGPQAEDVERLD